MQSMMISILAAIPLALAGLSQEGVENEPHYKIRPIGLHAGDQLFEWSGTPSSAFWVAMPGAIVDVRRYRVGASTLFVVAHDSGMSLFHGDSLNAATPLEPAGSFEVNSRNLQAVLAGSASEMGASAVFVDDTTGSHLYVAAERPGHGSPLREVSRQEIPASHGAAVAFTHRPAYGDVLCFEFGLIVSLGLKDPAQGARIQLPLAEGEVVVGMDAYVDGTVIVVTQAAEEMARWTGKILDHCLLDSWQRDPLLTSSSAVVHLAFEGGVVALADDDGAIRILCSETPSQRLRHTWRPPHQLDPSLEIVDICFANVESPSHYDEAAVVVLAKDAEDGEVSLIAFPLDDHQEILSMEVEWLEWLEQAPVEGVFAIEDIALFSGS